jgi:tetratricopeptide (TPR) repeat protein
MALDCRLAADEPASSSNSSWTDSVSSSVKQGFSKVGQVFNPKPAAPPAISADDPTSLSNKSKPGADLYVAIAQYYEQKNQTAEAEQQYQLALKEKPDYLPALLGCAQLKERQEKPDEALRLYERAIKAHPQQAAAYNNSGLCYARQGRLDKAVAALNRAVQLDPKNRLYHNNIAAVLVDQNQLNEAFAHLREAHGEAAAYYNMGFLLNKKGQTQAAMQQFALALKADPSMDAAQKWIDYLQRVTTQAQLPQHPAATGLKITSRPILPATEDAPLPEDPLLRRLPPIKVSQPSQEPAQLPGISYDNTVVAPLPPVLSSSQTGTSLRVN